MQLHRKVTVGSQSFRHVYRSNVVDFELIRAWKNDCGVVGASPVHLNGRWVLYRDRHHRCCRRPQEVEQQANVP